MLICALNYLQCQAGLCYLTVCACLLQLFSPVPASTVQLVIPHTRRCLGNRAFCIASPTAWNSLLSDIRTAFSVATFKNLLKTHLFIIKSYYTLFQLSAVAVKWSFIKSCPQLNFTSLKQSYILCDLEMHLFFQLFISRRF